MQIIGASFDSPEENQSFAEQEEFTFELWSDDDKTLALYYGAASESSSLAGRVTVILDSQGRLILEYPTVSPVSHAAQVLHDCELLSAAGLL